MNPDDYAIVVGIRRYPGFGRTDRDPRDLNGSDDDATEIYNWLVDPAKGGVKDDPDRIKLIRSRDYPDPFKSVLVAEPQKKAITDAFDWLDSIAQDNNAKSKGLRVGRRLYLYFSGHGFAQKRQEGGLFAANATRMRTYHVFASAWMNWFYNARYFDEIALWMDCCMTSDLSVVPEPAGYRILQGTGAGGKLFSAFAARYPLQTVERTMSDGKTHGVFTWALLQGLNGWAADPTTGEITSASLRNYLTNGMKKFLTSQDLQDTNIASEPDFGADDPITFAQVAVVPRFEVKLAFTPAAIGKRFEVVTGSPIRNVASGTANVPEVVLRLPNGLYFVVLDGVQKELEVVGGGHAVQVA